MGNKFGLLLSLLIFSVGFTSQLFSQKINKLYVVKNSAKFSSGDIVSPDIRDVNGDVAAALIIETDLEGLSFEANNGVVKLIHNQPGEYKLLLQPSERVVYIYAKNYQPLRIILYNYDIMLKSGQAWRIKITGDKQTDKLPVTIKTNIPDAKIYIDGKLQKKSKTYSVSKGKHKFRIEKYGYQVIDTTLNISSNNVYFEFKINPVELIPVKIKSIPSNARVLINGNEKGTTDYGDYYYPGKYKVRLIKPGYVDFIKEIEISNKKNDFVFRLVKNSGILNISVNPPDAQIKINTEIYSGNKFELKPGKYKIEILKSRYLPQTDSVTLAIGDTLYRKYTLTKNAAYLALNVNPPDANVEINKKRYSVNDTLSLYPGLYRLDVTKEGYFPHTESIELKLGKTVIKEISLKQKFGSLRFAVKPLDATIKLIKSNNVIETWSGLKQIPQLPVGNYLLLCKADGYKTKKINITIENEKTKVVRAELEPGNDYVNVDFNLGGNYDLYIDGKYKGSVSNGYSEIETGKHFVEFRRKDEIVKSYLNIEDNARNISIYSKPKTSIVLFSALLPGLGQITHNRVTTGAVYLTAFAGAGAYYYYSFKNYYKIKDELYQLNKQFNNTASPSEKYDLAEKVNNKNDELKKEYKRTNNVLYAVAGIYLVNILDALFVPTEKYISIAFNGKYKIKPQFAINGDGNLEFCVNIKF